MTKASVTTHDTTPHQDEADPAPLVYDTKSPEAPPMALDSYTPSKWDQKFSGLSATAYYRAVSVALMKGTEETGAPLEEVAALLDVKMDVARAALENIISQAQAMLAPPQAAPVSSRLNPV